eukprot:CAMPEP_0198307680 /NCGR_PEP_ID=MMETSP1450-20131203/505_1 /TAXON_ID=753684 ORGANISM="Madagascaria erythrocladiodes, Strain CCMP3234" /NCGR_SAMPLE_ID=MMETSP1450 /ASSEMBLY_ACC=CAM_ASM_001115 /LENGTH=691 /DNA_ID=CAMNT_0044010277 /DNA_START=143 /DNA_END=2217 /DNA_ORIENTATION=-
MGVAYAPLPLANARGGEYPSWMCAMSRTLDTGDALRPDSAVLTWFLDPMAPARSASAGFIDLSASFSLAVGVTPTNTAQTLQHSILKVPQIQLGTRWVLGTAHHRAEPSHSASALTAPHLHSDPLSSAARFALDLHAGRVVSVEYLTHPTTQSRRIAVQTVTLDLHGGHELHSAVCQPDGTVIEMRRILALCSYCEVSGKDACCCARGMRRRAFGGWSPVTGWQQFMERGRRMWCQPRRSTVHNVRQRDDLGAAVAQQTLSYCFAGRQVEAERWWFAKRCVERYIAGLGLDRLLLEPADDAVESDQRHDELEVSSDELGEIEAILAGTDDTVGFLSGADDNAAGVGVALLRSVAECSEESPDPSSSAWTQKSKGSRESRGSRAGGKAEKRERRWECPECQERFPNGYNLRRHQAGVHKKQRLFSCELCGKSFTQKGNLVDIETPMPGSDLLHANGVDKDLARRGIWNDTRGSARAGIWPSSCKPRPMPVGCGRPLDLPSSLYAQLYTGRGVNSLPHRNKMATKMYSTLLVEAHHSTQVLFGGALKVAGRQSTRGLLAGRLIERRAAGVVALQTADARKARRATLALLGPPHGGHPCTAATPRHAAVEAVDGAAAGHADKVGGALAALLLQKPARLTEPRSAPLVQRTQRHRRAAVVYPLRTRSAVTTDSSPTAPGITAKSSLARHYLAPGQ